MKLPILLPLALLPVAFGAGWLLGPAHGPDSQTAAGEAEAPPALAPDRPASEERLERLADEVERLSGRMEGLHRDVLGLRASLERRPLGSLEATGAAERSDLEPVRLVATPAAGTPTTGAPAQLAAPAATRETVLTVLAEEEARRKEERRLERQDRAAATTLERARTLAAGLELGASGDEALAELLTQQTQRTLELRASLQDLPREERGEAGRRAVEELAAWRTEQLNTRFEANTAAELARRMQERGGRDGRDEGGARGRRRGARDR